MNTLYICEKPSQARDIASVLGVHSKQDGYIEGDGIRVTWCLGHLLELAPPEHYCQSLKPWRMEVLPIIPKEWHWVPNKKTKSQLNTIKKLLKQTDHVVIATDADREGDVIGREILDYCHYQGQVQRLWFSALDGASIKKALADIRPGEATYPLYQAGLGRQRADWIIGMSMTMATSCLFGAPGQRVLSVGRVQTPTLNLIVERDRLIENFRSMDYFELDILFVAEQGEFLARWQAPENLTDINGHCLRRKTVKSVANKVEGQSGIVSVFEDNAKKKVPPVCFSLSSLQKVASSSLGLSAKKTLEVAQSLYEKHKATTYPRTDTGYLPVNQLDEAEHILNTLVIIDSSMKGLVSQCDTKLKAPIWNDKKVTAHHGIIPTLNELVDLNAMTKDELAIYDLIRRQYIGQFLGFYEYNQRKVEINCENEKFTVTSNMPKILGWKQAINKNQEDMDSGDKKNESTIPELRKNEAVTSKESHCLIKQTKPPARFTEGTLIATMKNIAKYVDDETHKKILKETAGIGTEATRADTIEKLLNRGYIRRDKKILVSTDRGRELVDLLPEQIKNPATTAAWEQELDNIAEGQGNLQDFLIDQEEVLEFMLEDLSKIRQTRGKGIDLCPQHPCPKCKSPLIRRKGKSGFFWGCSRYPDCNGLMQDKRGKTCMKETVALSDINCSNCQSSTLIKRRAKKKRVLVGLHTIS